MDTTRTCSFGKKSSRTEKSQLHRGSISMTRIFNTSRWCLEYKCYKLRDKFRSQAYQRQVSKRVRYPLRQSKHYDAFHLRSSLGWDLHWKRPQHSLPIFSLSDSPASTIRSSSKCIQRARMSVSSIMGACAIHILFIRFCS